ncbi:hypothetical protein Cgig2_031792 [Carnegiea gigantea]|uniref:Sulfotransferase domain-containing protein n=1 Tax=Carnegiea gigantea TaxID=171969 RepID=A0A9Q1KSI6_9CARY|nr:hypothetical protein Cgig2_031792 [Carnegiea gigantea]
MENSDEVQSQLDGFILSLPKEPYGSTSDESLYQYEGFWYYKSDLQGAIISQKTLVSVEPCDVVLATFPKSGTTWFKALIFTIMNRNQHNPCSSTSSCSNPHPLHFASPHDCASRWLEHYAYKNPTNPVPDHVPILSTHMPYYSLPVSVKSSCCPIVYVCRNTKDNFVSLWHFTNKMRSNKLPPISLGEAFELFCRGVSPFGPFWDHLLGYWKASLESPNKILFLKYEDMKREPGVCVKKLAEFIGYPFSHEEETQGVVQHIVEFCSFENLSNFEVNKMETTKSIAPTLTVSNNMFFRKVRKMENSDEVQSQLDGFILSLPKEPYGSTSDESLYQYEGFWYYKSDLQGAIISQKTLVSVEPCDVVLATFPKSGTTWFKALIFTIMNRNQHNPCSSTSSCSNSHPLHFASPHDCASRWLEHYAYKNPTNPVPDHVPILSTHMPYHSLPVSIKSSCCPIVYVCRNTKDNFVSLWHFTNKMRSNKLPPISLGEAFELFCRGVSPFGPFWDHLLGYWKASLESPNKILFLKYEDMKREPGVCVKKLAEFIGYPFSHEEETQGVVQHIVEFCSFENLSNFEVNKMETTKSIAPTLTVSNNMFFRKGQSTEEVPPLMGDY